MRNYEVTFIVDPVLSGDEIKATAQTYVDLLENEKCNIVHLDEMGLKQLAYPINRRQSGVYYCIEFEAESGEFIGNMELSLRRDERIMRFLTVALDKYGVKYNDDKRKGLIGSSKKKKDDGKDSDEGEKKKKQPPKKAPEKNPKKEATAAKKEEE
jgi:small subunit ribosomal protein S6